MNHSLAGNLLVASDTIKSGPEARTVCLLMHHDEAQTVGVILNRTVPSITPETPALLKSEADLEPQNDQNLAIESTTMTGLPQELAGFESVNFGGPMAGPVIAIHQSRDLAEVSAGHNIFISADKFCLQQLATDQTAGARLIVGYTGWSTDQLEHEISLGLWHTVPATAEMVFSGDDIWANAIYRATANTLASWINAPDDPMAWQLN